MGHWLQNRKGVNMKNKGKTLFSIIFTIILLIMPTFLINSYDQAEKLQLNFMKDKEFYLVEDMNNLLASAIVLESNQDIITFDDTIDQQIQQEILDDINQSAQAIYNNYAQDPNLYFTYNGKALTNSQNNKQFNETLMAGSITLRQGQFQLSNELSQYQDYLNNNPSFIQNILNAYDIYDHYTINYPTNATINFQVNADLVPSGNTYYTLNDEGIFVLVSLIYFAIIAITVGLFILLWPIKHEEESPYFRVTKNWKLGILLIIFSILYPIGFIGSVFCILATTNGYFTHYITTIDATTINNATMILNYLMWIFNILLISTTVFFIKYMFAHGFVHYLKYNTIIGTILRWFKNKFTDLSEFDLKDKFNKQIVKFVLFNGLIILIINILFPLSFIIFIFYIFMLLFFIKSKSDTIKNQYDQLLNATKQLSQGNININIENDLGIFNSLKDEFNNIKIGLKKAVEDETKSQNMKTELITNVSHDLKTPLTCIKNYVYLLKEEKDPAKQQEYIKELEQYSNRLTSLIEDLFEVSKINSGNISLNQVDLDIVSLLEQTLAECSDKLATKQLNIIKHFPNKEIIVHLDGDKTYRIFENLLSNISKYALDNSRVYLDILEEEKDVIITFKNISREEMNFSKDEITERFVRGDKSRHESGSGLGLAIAKSFTEAQDGTFNIDIDGDLFKVTILFKKLNMSNNLDMFSEN